MKATRYLAALLVAAFCAAPVMAAVPAMDKAVKLAAPDSGASIKAVCKSVYDAVKADPDKADEVFSQVIAQRKDWTSAEVYAIFRAVLLANPQLEEEFRNHSADCEKLKRPEADCTCWATKSPMIYKLLAALNGAGLPKTVVSQVLANASYGTFDLARINHSLMGAAITQGNIPTPPVAPSTAPAQGLLPPLDDMSSSH